MIILFLKIMYFHLDVTKIMINLIVRPKWPYKTSFTIPNSSMYISFTIGKIIFLFNIIKIKPIIIPKIIPSVCLSFLPLTLVTLCDHSLYKVASILYIRSLISPNIWFNLISFHCMACIMKAWFTLSSLTW